MEDGGIIMHRDPNSLLYYIKNRTCLWKHAWNKKKMVIEMKHTIGGDDDGEKNKGVVHWRLVSEEFEFALNP